MVRRLDNLSSGPQIFASTSLSIVKVLTISFGSCVIESVKCVIAGLKPISSLLAPSAAGAVEPPTGTVVEAVLAGLVRVCRTGWRLFEAAGRLPALLSATLGMTAVEAVDKSRGTRECVYFASVLLLAVAVNIEGQSCSRQLNVVSIQQVRIKLITACRGR